MKPDKDTAELYCTKCGTILCGGPQSAVQNIPLPNACPANEHAWTVLTPDHMKDPADKDTEGRGTATRIGACEYCGEKSFANRFLHPECLNEISKRLNSFDSLKSERDALRGALERIRETIVPCNSSMTSGQAAAEMRRIAHEALTGEKNNG